MDVDGDGAADDVDLDDEAVQMEMWDLRHDVHSVAAQNLRDVGLLESYINFTYPRDSNAGHLMDLLEKPHLARSVVENYITPDEAKWETLVMCLGLPKPRVRIIYILGEINSGKSAIAYDLAKAIKEISDRPVVELKVGEDGTLPDFVDRRIVRLDQAPRGAVVIDQEAAVNNSSSAGATKEGRALAPAAATIRHQDLIWIVISQNSKLANPIFFTMAQMIIFKPIGLTQSTSERGPMRRTIKYWRELIPRDPSETFVLSKHVPPYKFTRPKPEWFTDEVSTSYAKIEDRATAAREAGRLRATNMSWETIATRMTSRYESLHHNTWRDIVIDHHGGIDPATGKKPRRRRASNESEGGPHINPPAA